MKKCIFIFALCITLISLAVPANFGKQLDSAIRPSIVDTINAKEASRVKTRCLNVLKRNRKVC